MSMNVGQLMELLAQCEPDLDVAVIINDSGELREIVDFILDDDPVRIIASEQVS